MKAIQVSTDVFARIWAQRVDGEESEDAILSRVLSRVAPSAEIELQPDVPASNFYDRGPRTWSQPTWATDIAEVLQARGGKSRLQYIYDDVEKLRRAAGRSVPRSIEAIVRRTLENHSSDSHNYNGGADLFCMPEGKGAGIWALRGT